MSTEPKFHRLALERSQDVLKRLVRIDQDQYSDHPDTERHFEEYAAVQVLKDNRLCRQQIRSGIVRTCEEGANDGGIDCIYLFADNELVDAENVCSFLERKSAIPIELVMLQAKFSSDSSWTAIEKLARATRDLLEPSGDLSNTSIPYNLLIFDTIKRFHRLRAALADNMPIVKVIFYYVTLGALASDDVKGQRQLLNDSVVELIPNCKVEYQFVGAHKLSEIISRSPNLTRTMKYTGGAIESNQGRSFVTLVNVAEFARFVSKGNGKLRENLFDANVRDWQGTKGVNEQIRHTLETKPVQDFWWQNNGVTIIASEVTDNGDSLTLVNPFIVNGLQTTESIHRHFDQHDSLEGDDRKVMVRVFAVREDDESDTREHIIRATNRHTPVRVESMRALDEIQYEIERYLYTREEPLYYERRQRFYRNQKKPKDKIVSITELAQSVLATVFHLPDEARGRPGNYLQNSHDKSYQKLFNLSYDPELYYFCARFHKKTLATLDDRTKFPDITREIRGRIVFHVMTHVILRRLGIARIRIANPTKLIAQQKIENIDEGTLTDSGQRVIDLFRNMRAKSGFRYADFNDAFLSKIDSLLPQP